MGSNNNKTQLENLLNTYNLLGTVHFPTRFTNTSMTSIDNIFIDGRNNYNIKPHINGLSDHNAQLLTLEDSDHANYNNETIHIRKINDCTTAEFQ